MKQAVSNVAWYSDDEDYVSFDEEDLNTGIQDLYDDRSASEAGSDISDDEYFNNNNKQSKSKSKDSKRKIQKKRKKHKHKHKKRKKNKKANSAIIQDNKPNDANKPIKKKSSIFGDLFSGFLGGSNSNNNTKSDAANIKQEQVIAPKPMINRDRSLSISYSESDSNETDNESSSSSSSSSDSLPKRKGRNKISKRIAKLSEMKKQKEKKEAMGKRKVIHKQKVNAKIISIELGTLKNSAENIATGDPIRCKNEKCGAIFSKYDTLLKQHDDIKLDDDDESIWICSFCNNVNVIEIDEEEMPKSETIDYILEPPEENKDNDNKNDSNEIEDKQIIFCIDISGSMCVTQPVEGKKINLKGDRLQKYNDELSQFMDPMNRNQWMPNQSQNVTYISRLQSVQAAVDEQMEKLKVTNPNMKVGLVTFNNEVIVFGDAMKDENNGFEIITGDKLNNLNKLKEIGISDKCKIRNNIFDSHKSLSNELWKLEENGQTALGPALSISIGMASIKRGSQVILCTDGLANIGVGKIDENDDNNNTNDISSQFYADLGNWALEKGVCVSIISITDDGCKLEDLGKIVEITGGNLRRINPLKLTDKFSGIIEQEIIATLTNAKMLIHPGLQFVDTAKQLQNLNPFTLNEKDKNKLDNKMSVIKENEIKDNKKDKIYSISRSTQDVGNVFSDTTIFFEYEVCKDKISEFKHLKYLPFQVHILYNKNNGSKMLRVITQQKEVTMDNKSVRENLDFKILSKYSTRVTTKLCGIGDYEASRAWTQANVRYMHNNVKHENDLYHVASHVNSNVALDYQMGKQQINEKITISNENNNNNNNNKKNDGWSWKNLIGQKNNNNDEDNDDDDDDEDESDDCIHNNNNNNNNASTWSWRGSNNQKYRSSQRNDKFSSLTYGMKKKY